MESSSACSTSDHARLVFCVAWGLCTCGHHEYFTDPPELPKKRKKVSGKKPTQKGRLLAQLAAAEADAESAAQRERDALQRFGDVRQPCSKWG